ncbi:vWA domain-containing protein, partial [Methanohalophilus sp.]
MLSFEQPIILALILPVLAGALYLMLKGGNKKMLISRAVVLSLLVVALASPFTLVSQVTEQENPQLVIISDETDSMQLFEEGVADELYESLTTKTPTSLVRLSGDKTALGDAIVQYASSDNQVVLVTDGNNNYGENLEDSLQYAEKINSTVYAVTPGTQHNDMSVRIKGEKTAVLGEYIFDIVVEQANRELVDYSINLYVDGEKRNGLLSTVNPHSTKQNVIRPKEPIVFDEVGAHEIKVELVPKSEDYDSINNEFTKSVYVVPKPKVQYVTGENYNSAFASDLNQLYTPVTDDNFTQLDGKKAVIIDNLYIDALSENDIANLQKYVTNGGGLVVIGGDQSYNNGDYRNSSLEKLLPVYSYPTENVGGEVVVL